MSPITANLEAKNKAYAASFTQGDLALPPAKKYAVGESPDGFLVHSPVHACCGCQATPWRANIFPTNQRSSPASER